MCSCCFCDGFYLWRDAQYVLLMHTVCLCEIAVIMITAVMKRSLCKLLLISSQLQQVCSATL